MLSEFLWKVFPQIHLESVGLLRKQIPFASPEAAIAFLQPLADQDLVESRQQQPVKGESGRKHMGFAVFDVAKRISERFDQD